MPGTLPDTQDTVPLRKLSKAKNESRTFVIYSVNQLTVKAAVVASMSTSRIS